MRIVSVIVLGIATGCFANRSATPGAWLRTPHPESLTRTPGSPRLMAPDTRGLIVAAPAPRTSPGKSVCIDCHSRQVTGPYVMIIDGTAYRMPEDSARVGKRLQPIDIDEIQVIAGVAASQRYHTDGRPVVLVKTKRSRKY